MMADAGYNMLEVRFLIKPDFTECYVYCEALGDCPIGIQGWHYKIFPKEIPVEEIMKIYPTECILWTRKAPSNELEAENEQLREALLEHRGDLHRRSNRPCPTCRQSAKILGIKVPDQCAKREWDEQALKARKAVNDG